MGQNIFVLAPVTIIIFVVYIYHVFIYITPIEKSILNEKPKCNFKRSVSSLCSYSPKHKMALVLIPKSGSSTGRHLFKHELGGYDISCNKLPKGTKLIATIRDPYKRFLSSYDEVFVRRLGRPFSIPQRYRRFMMPFDGIKYTEYEKLFNSPTLDSAFVEFVEDYDGEKAFDVHLTKQKDVVLKYGIKTYGSLSDIKKLVLDSIDPSMQYIHGRAYKRRFNVDKIPLKTQAKICKLVKDDYCCLGMKIPPPCDMHINCYT